MIFRSFAEESEHCALCPVVACPAAACSISNSHLWDFRHHDESCAGDSMYAMTALATQNGQEWFWGLLSSTSSIRLIFSNEPAENRKLQKAFQSAYMPKIALATHSDWHLSALASSRPLNQIASLYRTWRSSLGQAGTQELDFCEKLCNAIAVILSKDLANSGNVIRVYSH